jgi:hypothetical protein
MGREWSWRHVDATATGVEIFEEGPILGVGRQLYKVNELIPQTRSLVPGPFQIDTATLIELFIPPHHPPDRQGRTKTSFINKDYKAHLWNLFLRRQQPRLYIQAYCHDGWLVSYHSLGCGTVQTSG